MNGAVLFHNPECSKSRAALELLLARGVEPRIVDYRSDPPTVDELRSLMQLLGEPAHVLVRDTDPAALEAGLTCAKSLTEEEILQRLHANPALLQRPILVHAGRAVIARPPERVLELVAAER